MSIIHIGHADTKLGRFHVAVENGAVLATQLPDDRRPELEMWLDRHRPGAQLVEGGDPLLENVAAQLTEWAAGERSDFDLPLADQGTAFQAAVWKALEAIPYGEVASYADVAAAIGKPGAARAVGQANNRNPLAPFVPCHRVVTADGGLGGYGGGEALKVEMLKLEGVSVGPGGAVRTP
ncbi:MAG: methylated-DNA--[protein]-cysteine S-methyltransferase [Thermoplasmatota archaeon]